MKWKVLGTLAAGAALMFGASKGDKPTPGSDAAIAEQVRHEVVMYPHYSIWDDINFRVNGGQVELSGAVSQPYKKTDLERLVRGVPGVTGITDEVRVLPLSPQDDRLRIQVARAIFRDPVFSGYALQAVPPIHIIVDNGHVTLTGAVRTEMEKQIAGMRASAAGLSFGPVVNKLVVEQPGKKS
jgi:hyperosmotically inducible protein